MQLHLDLLKQVLFVNLGPYRSDNENYYQWTSKSNFKATIFDIRLSRNAPFTGIFYCVSKSDLKLVYYVEKDVVFTIGAEPEIQSLLLEAILEYLIKEFFETYDESLLMTCYGDVCNIFDGFSKTVEHALVNYDKLDLFERSFVTCKGCNKTLNIIIKKSIIEHSTKPTIPIVYIHSGHALLLYVDKQYKVRGAELVSISY